MPKWFWDFCEFWKSIFSRWVELVTGGSIAFAWLLYNRITEREVSMTTFYWILGMAFLFAVFGTWREQYLKVQEYVAKRADFYLFAEQSEPTSRTERDSSGQWMLYLDLKIALKNGGD